MSTHIVDPVAALLLSHPGYSDDDGGRAHPTRRDLRRRHRRFQRRARLRKLLA